MSSSQNLTLFADIKALLSRHEWLVSFLTALGTFFVGTATGAVAVYSFVKSEVDSTVTKRLAPYEALLTGLSLNQGEDYDVAAETFREAINNKEMDSLPPSAQDSIYDGFLYAIVNCNQPELFLPELQRIKSRIGTKVTESPWRTHQIGWYLLRTGKANEAKDYFVRAKQLFDAYEESNAGVDPARGLLYAALIENKLDDALRLSAEIKHRSPLRYFTNSDLIRDIKQWPKERNFKSYIGYYGAHLQQTIDMYANKLIDEDNKNSSAR